MNGEKVIIGRTEHIVIPSESARKIRVKIDTGRQFGRQILP